MSARLSVFAFSHAPARRRLTAALAASALVHVLFTGVLPGGGRGGPVAVSSPGALAVHLAPGEPSPPVVEPAIERIVVPAPARPRERKLIAPTTPARAVEAAGQDGGLGFPDTTYYGVRQLDVFPALAGAFELRYPARAAEGDVKGRVALLVLIDAQGAVDDVSVVDAQPAGYFEEDALRALRSARFRPALKGGRAVKSRLVIEITYGGG